MSHFNPNEFAKASALMAIDQGGTEEMIGQYFDNLRDTMSEEGVTNHFEITEAEETYWNQIEEARE